MLFVRYELTRTDLNERERARAVSSAYVKIVCELDLRCLRLTQGYKEHTEENLDSKE